MKVAPSIVVAGALALMAACSEVPASPRAGAAGRVDPPPAGTGTFAPIQRAAGGTASGGATPRATDSSTPEPIRLPPVGANGMSGTYQPATGNYGFGAAGSPAPKHPATGVPDDHEE